METNFFQQISALGVIGNIVLNIQPISPEQMIVSVLITNDSIKDKAIKNIPPMVLDGSIADLDEKFFTAITEPVKKTTELFRNLAEHEKGLKTAQGSNNMQRGKNEAEKKDKDGKRKQYDEKMKKVDELEKEKKYGQAIAQMPDVKLFPEFANEINKKMTQLRSNHGTLDLFADQSSGSDVTEEITIPEEGEEIDLDNPSLEDDDPEEGLEDDPEEEEEAQQ
jgi:PRTRC genetic system protein E